MNTEQTLLERFINVLLDDPKTVSDSVDFIAKLTPRNIQIVYKLAAIFKPDELEDIMISGSTRALPSRSLISTRTSSRWPAIPRQ